MTGKKPNNYIIDGEIVKMELTRRNKPSIWTIFDKEDLKKVISFPYSWHADYNKNGHQYYVAAAIFKEELRKLYGGSTIRLHSFLLEQGRKGEVVVDHINGDSLDNRKCNLRMTDYVINAQNRKSCNRNNFTGLRNVCMVDGRYLVQFKVNGESRRFGPFDHIEEANHAATVLRGKFYV